MKVGILGSGAVAKLLATGFLNLGYEVKLGTRDSNKLIEWTNSIGAKGEVGTFEEAASFGEIIVLAINWSGVENAINLANKKNFYGKIVIDVTNPLDFSKGVPPKFVATYGNSAGEQIQNMLNDSKVVKAFNTVSASIMINPKLEDGDPDLLIAGNDESAKKSVTEIAKSFGWKNVIDIGDIKQSYWLETFAMLWIEYGFKYNRWTHAFKLLYK